MSVNPDNLFSNGTEYMGFLESNCLQCKNFVRPNEATPENPVCKIEEAVALAGIGETENFPVDELIPNGRVYRYDCRQKVAREK